MNLKKKLTALKVNKLNMRNNLTIFLISLVHYVFAQTKFTSGSYLGVNAISPTALYFGTNSVKEAYIDIYNAYLAGNISLEASNQIVFHNRAHVLPSSGNYTHAYINPSHFEVYDMYGTWNPVKFEKLEMGIQLPQNIQSQINNFLTTNSGVNPYDPDQIKIECKFISPSNNSYVRYGFYYRDFTVSNNVWTEQSTIQSFRIRFAPPETGKFLFSINLYLAGVLQGTFNGHFNVNSSSHKGHLIMASGNRNKLQFQNGDVFFGIGQNIPYAIGENVSPCIDQTYYTCNCHSAYEKQRNYIIDLANNGGNFTRIRIDSWSNPIQWPYKPILIGENQNPYNPSSQLVDYLYNYDVNQRHMWELDKTINTCENSGVYPILCLLEDQNFSVNSVYDPGGSATWNKNPYSALLGNNLQGCKNFFSDPNAMNIFKKYLFYIAARWGYSRSLSIWELINETINLANNSNSNTSPDHFFVNDPTFRTNVVSWICNMKSYLESFYPWHPITTGAGSKNDELASKNFNDINCLNIWSDNQYTKEVSTISGDFSSVEFEYRFDRSLTYFYNYKPFMWGELGIADDCNAVDNYIDRQFHNSIWASTFSGGISNGLYWNDWQQVNGVNHRYNFQALNNFVNRIDFSQPLYPNKSSDGANQSSVERVNSYYMKTSNNELIYGWANNHSSNWTSDLFSKIPSSQVNYIDSCTGFNGTVWNYNINTYPSSKQIKVENIKTSARYKIKIFGTYDNSNQLQSDFNVFTNSNGVLAFGRFMPRDIQSPFYPDYAFIAEYNPVCLGCRENLKNDTILLSDADTLCFDSKLSDKQDEYSYQWSFGNGRTSNSPQPCAHYNNEGVYNVELIATKNSDKSVSVYNQTLIITRFNNQTVKNGSINIFPIPASTKAHLMYDHEKWINPIVELYDQLGRKYAIEMIEPNIINVENLTSGVYLIKFNEKENVETVKMVISH